MDPNERKMDENVEEESFAELLEKSFVDSRKLERGQKVKAVILKITDEWVFLDLGRKSEGYLATKELLDKEGNITVKEGDTIQAFFLSEENNENLFTTRIGGGEAARVYLEDAQRSGIPVEGHVEKEIKGGFEVKIPGGLRAFCPYSQMGLQRVDNPGQYVGQRLPFKIVEYGERGRNVIVSNRAVLEEERRAKKEAMKESLSEGMTVRGTITSIRNFGAFVDIGGIEGLIPISEIAWGRVEDIHEVLSVGQEVDIVVLKLDWERDRFSFSIKGAMPDPWDNVVEKYQQGSIHTGRVARLANYGAFVTLEEGVDGLIHISRLGGGRRLKHPSEVLSQGQTVEVKIESVERENKRISLSMPQVDRERAEEESDNFRHYVKESPSSMGTLGDMLRDKFSGGQKDRKK